MKKILEILALILRDFSSVITYVSLFLWIIAMMYYLRWYSLFIVLFILILSDHLKKYIKHEYDVFCFVEDKNGDKEITSYRVVSSGESLGYGNIIQGIMEKFDKKNVEIIIVYKIK